MTPLAFEIAYECAPAARAVLEGVGRTEDMRFSPDNRRLALVGFEANSIAIADIEIDTDAGRSQVRVTAAVEFASQDLLAPHGVDFVNDTTIIVSNRDGSLVLYEVPPDLTLPSCRLVPINPSPDFPIVREPGSVRIQRDRDARIEVFVCGNADNVIARHVLVETSAGYAVESSDVVLRRWLMFPDGVAVGRDGWLAVSNHDAPAVLVYERSTLPDEQASPAAVLRGASYPHGVCFAPEGGHLFVADSASPCVLVYVRPERPWSGVRYPSFTLRVMDQSVFEQARATLREGGPKGLDIDHSGRVLAVTSQYQRLRFFDVGAVTDHVEGAVPDSAAVVEYELTVLGASGARVVAAEQRVTALRRSRSYRATAPWRWLNSRLAALARRGRRT